MSAVKWIGLVLLLFFAFAIAIPNYLVDKKFDKAMRDIPKMGFGMMLALVGIGRKK
jgi:uncharacterized protein YneF (UPF0154 family)